MRQLKFTIIFLLILVSCNRSRYDYGGYAIEQDTEFGNNLILTYADTTIKHLFNDSTKTQQEGVFLNYHINGNIDTMFIGEGTIVVESHVSNVKSDSNYIIIDQKPLDLIFGELENKEFNPHRPNWPGNANEAEKMLRGSPIHKYWIIKKGTKDVYSPYTQEQYLIKRKELEVPDKIRFDFE